MDPKREQVAKQCDAVVHLAKSLVEVYGDYAKMFRDAESSGPDKIADQVGKRTAYIMETLGDILNGMDAVTDDDAWLDPIFEEAQRLWPQASV